MNRDGARKSIWQEEIKSFSSNPDFETVYDVAIVGGGITGVSTAVKLQQEGKKCIILEASNIGFGTTGGTTAHLNDFFDTTFSQAVSDFGLDNAKIFAKAGQDAIQLIKNNIQQFNIDCDFEHKSAYLFALPKVHPKAPWSVKKGGIWLQLYKHSLSTAFAVLFLASFLMHFYGSLKDYNEEQVMKNKETATALQYIVDSRFWFESFQNWQSEFLAVFSLVVLSIWLREKGSPESKPVDAAHDKNA